MRLIIYFDGKKLRNTGIPPYSSNFDRINEKMSVDKIVDSVEYYKIHLKYHKDLNWGQQGKTELF